MSHSQATVFIVDDDPAVLKSLSRLLRSANLEAVTFTSPEEFLEQHRSHPNCCLVLDLLMPGLSGLELQEALAARKLDIPIVFLSGRGDIPRAVQAIQRGATSFLTKPVDGDTLLMAVEQALGESRAAWQARIEREELEMRIDRLTSRERAVMIHVVAGKLNKQIAADLGIAEKTVKVHRARMMRKMDVVSVASLVRLAERAGDLLAEDRKDAQSHPD